MIALLFAVGLAFDLAPKPPAPKRPRPPRAAPATPAPTCGRNPDSVCASGVCYDPPPDVRWLLAWDDDVERPACMTSLRETACGFHCIKHVDGRVRCAQTPEGACHSNQEAIGCWDPPEGVRWRMLQARRVEYASCLSFLDDILVCGYHCTAVGTHMACAASPQGSCETHFTEVACFDPPWLDVAPTATP